jgi:flagellar biosynthesis/type III secretory pathway protein FliH
MPSSASALSAASPAHFALWPLPDLRVVTQAVLDAEQARDEPSEEELAYDRGVAEGGREARAAAEAEWRAAIKVLATAADAVRASRSRWLDTAEANLYALATAVAHQVIGREVAIEPELVLELVRRALDEIDAESPVSVRVHPQDLPLVQARLDATGAEAGAEQIEIAFAADASLSRGGCIVETPRRLVDGRIETALQALYVRLSDG